MISEIAKAVRRDDGPIGSRLNTGVAVEGVPVTFAKSRNCAVRAWFVLRLVATRPTNIGPVGAGERLKLPSCAQFTLSGLAYPVKTLPARFRRSQVFGYVAGKDPMLVVCPAVKVRNWKKHPLTLGVAKAAV